MKHCLTTAFKKKKKYIPFSKTEHHKAHKKAHGIYFYSVAWDVQ